MHVPLYVYKPFRAYCLEVSPEHDAATTTTMKRGGDAATTTLHGGGGGTKAPFLSHQTKEPSSHLSWSLPCDFGWIPRWNFMWALPCIVFLLPGQSFYEDSWYKADLNKYHTLAELSEISSELGIFLWLSPDLYFYMIFSQSFSECSFVFMLQL